MNTLLRSVALVLVGGGLLAGMTGCELQNCDVTTKNADGTTSTKKGVCAKSLTNFPGKPETKQAQWASGGSITIDGFNGPITVVRGSGTMVTATFTPTDLRAYDTSDADVQADFDALVTQVTANGNDVTVKTTFSGNAHSGLSAGIKVQIPDSFDGALSVTQANGDTSVQFAGNATSVKLSSKNGSCSVAAGSAASVDVSCHNGELSGSVGALPAGAQGGTIATGNGSITMKFDGTQKFNVQASALAGGTVDVGNAADAGCTVVAGGSDSAQTVSCAGATTDDPTYVINADGTSLADVTLSF